MANKEDPYYSKKDALRWHGANFQIIQVFVNKVLRPTYSFETHPMNGTNQLNGTSSIMIHEQYAKVKLKLQHFATYRGNL